MYGEIITIGRELLMGEIVDTNASYIAQRLAEAGVTVRWVSQVGDDIDHLVEAFDRALKRSDVTVSCGGLGPTSDDLTREAVAKVLGEKPVVDPQLLAWLEGVFRDRGIEMPKTNVKQATLIPSATSIPNDGGTAPGWWVTRNDRHIILTPGPPREIQRMWEGQIGPKLEKISGADVLYSRTLKTAGITEGGIDEMLTDLFGKDNPYLGIYARSDGISLRIIARAPRREAAEELARPVESEIRKRLGAAIWGVDNETPGTRVRQLLAESGRTLSVVEAGSGGAAASMLGESDDAHGSFFGAYVLNGALRTLPPSTLENLGPGSALQPLGEESALKLAEAARAQFQSDIGLGISPRGLGDDQLPEGTVFVGMVSDRGRRVATSRFARGRANPAQRAALFALVELAAALTAEAV